jgi:hypothetical protein
MSILAGLGAVPSNLTVPLTVATVLGSMGAAVAGAAVPSVVFSDCSVFSFLLHAPKMSTQPTARIARNAFQFFLIMI